MIVAHDEQRFARGHQNPGIVALFLGLRDGLVSVVFLAKLRVVSGYLGIQDSILHTNANSRGVDAECAFEYIERVVIPMQAVQSFSQREVDLHVIGCDF